jgi:lipoprotein-anchoring transpeptidase ErfK/SrfK
MKSFFIALISLITVFSAPWVQAESEDKDPDQAIKEAPRPSFGSSSRSTARSVYLTPTLPSLNEKRILAAILWHVDETKPITRLQISLSQQKVYAYQGDTLAAISPISTGKQGHNTPLGQYKVLQKNKNHQSNLYGSFIDAQGKVIDENAEAGQKPPEGTRYQPSPMPHYLRLCYNGIGLHAGYLPGYAASHGCIRLPPSFAEELFAVVPMKTPVEIIQ